MNTAQKTAVGYSAYKTVKHFSSSKKETRVAMVFTWLASFMSLENLFAFSLKALLAWTIIMSFVLPLFIFVNIIPYMN